MGGAIKSTKANMKTLVAKLEHDAGTSVSLCYQCGKCSAGCPVSFAMDYPPRQIIRLLQLGLEQEALEAKSIWICASCDTCSTRCPKGVEIASLMDALRREALAQGKINDKKVAEFNKAFLSSVKQFGRVFEPGLLLQHNLMTKQFLKDANLGLPMIKRGKLGMYPAMIKGRDEIKRIFERASELGGE